MSEKQKALRSPWVLAWIGMFVIFVLANIVMIYLAETGGSRLIVDDYYDRGQDYEKNMLKRMAKARELGWNMKIEEPEYADVGKPVTYGFRILSKEEQPVIADSVTFYVYRPADADQDFSVPMKQVEPGYYQADISFPLLGVWEIIIEAVEGENVQKVSSRLSAGVK